MTCSNLIDTLESRQMFSAAAPVVMGYLPDYAPNSAAVVNTLVANHFEGLTQVNYFSVNPNVQCNLPGTGNNASTQTTSGWELASTAGHSSDLDALVTKAHAAGVKVNIVVAGGGDNSIALNNLLTPRKDSRGNLTPAADAAAFDTFSASVQTFCTNHHVDGVDLDWEPDGATQGQINNYEKMIHALKTETHGLQLSAAVNSQKLWLAPDYGTTSYVLTPQAVRDLDLVNVMTYDLGNPGDGAPVQTAQSNMNDWGAYAAESGASKSKLIFGLPFYGTATTLQHNQTDMPDDNPWKFVTESNTSAATFGQLMSTVGASNVSTTGTNNLVFNNLSINGTFKGHNSRTAWNFDGRGTIAGKTSFALNNGFGGVMAWDLSGDYFNAGQYDAAKSLLPAVKDVVTASTGSGATVTPPASTPVNTVGQLTGDVTGTTGSWGGLTNTRDKAFDNDLTTFFDAPTEGTAANPNWVGLDLHTAKTITQIKFAARANQEWRMEGGLFQASNSADFSSGTVNLYAVPNTAAPSSTCLTTVNVSTTGSFRYVRFLSPAGAYGNLSEMQVFGSTPAQSQAAAQSIFSTTTIAGGSDNSDLLD